MNGFETHLDNFRHVNGGAPEWLRNLRARGLSRFTELGFPTTRQEEWKYTNVTPLANSRLRLGEGVTSEQVTRAVGGLGFEAVSQLVFVNGRYAAALSSSSALPNGVKVESLAAALKASPDLIEPHLSRCAAFESRAFTALNTAFIEDGAVVYLAKGVALPRPVHLVFVTTVPGEPIVCHPRSLIVAEEGSEATVVESYAGFDGETYCTNAVTEIVVGPGAKLAHYRLQSEGSDAFHVASVEARQGAASRFHSQVISLGGVLTRADIDTVLDAEGCECSLDGLYLATGRQHVDHHTSIDHQKPHCSSRQLYKGVLDDKSSGVFNGKVLVRPHAQKSDAAQVNRNLLLSGEATVDTKPQLEIFADDVRCSHGATIGRLDEDAIFYMRSRGIDQAKARDLLVYAFANEVVGRIKVEPVRQKLEQILGSRFQGAEALQ